MGDPQCVFGILRFCFDSPKKVYNLLCKFSSDESKKNLRKLDSVHRATFERILGVAMSDTS